MIRFEADVSGEDLLSKDYTICIANKDIIKGFKFSEDIVRNLSSRYGQGLYRYNKSARGKANFKVRVYCVVIYYLFKFAKVDEEITLYLCRDFQGRENDIKENLKFFLGEKLGLSLGDRFYFTKLEKDSSAHKYAFLMRKDTKNKMQTYVEISLGEIEQWLQK